MEMIDDSSMKEKLRRIIEETDTKAGRIFDIFIQSLIIASLLAFSVGTIPDLSEKTIAFLRVFEIISVLIFSVEYVLRISVADKKLKYILSFYGLVDLLAILPFYLSIGIDARALRALRLFRLFRIVKLLRFSKALNRFHIALKMAREELAIFFMVTLLLLFLTGVGIYFFENAAQPEVYTSLFTSL